MDQGSVQETYLQLWEALCQGHDGSRDGRRLKLQVVDTVLFRGGRPCGWVFNDKEGFVRAKHRSRLEWVQITRHLLRLLPSNADRDEAAAVLRYVTPGCKKLQTTVLNRRELQDLGGSPAACSSALGGGELVALQAAPQPYVGDGSGVFACRCRFDKPEHVKRICAEPGQLDASVTIASAVTREYVDWPERKQGKKMISERSRASDPKGVKRGKQCATAVGCVVAHAAHVRGAPPLSSLTCEFAFDKKGRPALCHVLDVSGGTRKLANCPTPLAHGYVSPTSDEAPPRAFFEYSPPTDVKSPEAFAPKEAPVAWSGDSAAAVRMDARRRREQFRQKLDAASLLERAPAPAPAPRAAETIPHSQGYTGSRSFQVAAADALLLRHDVPSDRRIASQVALEKQFQMRSGDAGRELLEACARAEKARLTMDREREVLARRRDRYVEVEDGLDVVRTNPLIDARKAAEEDRRARDVRRKRDLALVRAATERRLERLAQPLRRPQSAPLRRKIRSSDTPPPARRPKTGRRRKPRKSDLSKQRWREAETEARRWPLYGEKRVKCVRMRDPRTLAKQWDQQVRDGAITWVGQPLENAPPPPGEPDPEGLWACIGKKNPNAKPPPPTFAPGEASVGLTASEVRLARAFTNQNLVERLVPLKPLSPRSYMAGRPNVFSLYISSLSVVGERGWKFFGKPVRETRQK